VPAATNTPKAIGFLVYLISILLGSVGFIAAGAFVSLWRATSSFLFG
jgi:hypothetical protein